jgi:hypothetical protein
VAVNQCTLFDSMIVDLHLVRCVWSDYTGICMNDSMNRPLDRES